eukprot:6181821-Pleurochrysis_carterae.AAC.5
MQRSPQKGVKCDIARTVSCLLDTLPPARGGGAHDCTRAALTCAVHNNGMARRRRRVRGQSGHGRSSSVKYRRYSEFRNANGNYAILALCAWAIATT